MIKHIFRFSALLLIVLIVVFGIHQYILSYRNLPRFGNSLILSYTVNAFLAIFIYAVIHLLKKKLKDQLGFIFMIGSFLKFAVFFIVFQPIYKADNDISRPEFFAFFVPYAICLIIEIICLSKWLNQLR